MQTSKAKLIRRGLIASVASASLVLGAGGPASADVVVGAGAGVAYDYPTNVQTPPGDCTPLPPPPINPDWGNPTAIHVDSNRFEAEHPAPGTFSGLDAANNPVVYVGQSHVTVNVGAHLISPVGTHTSGCPDLVPEAVDITSASVTSDSDDVNCSGDVTGTWLRAGTSVVIDVTFTESDGCSVTGNQLGFTGTAEAPTHLVLTYEGVPCTVPLAEEPNPACSTPAPPEADPGAIYAGSYEAESLTS